MIINRYRSDYDGEFVVVKTTFTNGQKVDEREWIPNAIENHHISGRAAVIGTNLDSKRFDYRRLQKHRGGLLGKKRLQTYGSGILWQDMIFDFFVTQDQHQLAKMSTTDYDTRSTVYTNSKLCLEHPGRFYLIPYLPRLHDMALPAYLAAFDEHKEIFLIGYSAEDTLCAKWIADLSQVIESYSEVSFFFVGRKSNMPVEFGKYPNVRAMDNREFVYYCDI